MIKTVGITSLIVISLLSFNACSYDKSEELIAPISVCDSIISYKKDIDPLIRTYCITGIGPGTGCHDAWILTYEGVKPQVKYIKAEVTSRRMPEIPNNFGIIEMTQEEIDMFVCWIDNGAPDN